MHYPNYNSKSSNFKLYDGEIHIWYANLDHHLNHLYEFVKILSQDERIRADKFYDDRDKICFIVRRGILRMMLGRYLAIDPGKVQFTYGEHGKPALRPVSDMETIFFNMSHSAGRFIFAFTNGGEIGVDIENLCEISEMNIIANQIFTKRENEIFHEIPNDKKNELFFCYWTRKEAFIKATGYGLHLPLDEFDISHVQEGLANLPLIDTDSKEPYQWYLWDLKPFIGYVAACIVKGRRQRLKCELWL